MLSTNPNMVVAGVMLVDDEYCPIYVHLETGDCAFENPNTATACLISEISVDDPLETTDVIQLERSVEGFPFTTQITFAKEGKTNVSLSIHHVTMRMITKINHLIPGATTAPGVFNRRTICSLTIKLLTH